MKTAWLFPGQGAQEVGMALDLIHAHATVRHRLEQASDRLGADLVRTITDGPRAALARTDVAQPALFALSFAIGELLSARGLAPTWTAGHSLGQFSAAATAGALSYADALDLVIERGRVMHEVNGQVDGGMIAVSGITAPNLQRLVERSTDGVWIANRNAPTQTVLAGGKAQLQALVPALAAAGARSTWLDVAGPYHTPLFADAATTFARGLARCRIGDARVPLIANTSAIELQGHEALRHEFGAHMLCAVDWVGSMAVLDQRGCELLVEVGPGRTMKGLALRNLARVPCITTGSLGELDDAFRRLEEAACALS